MFDLKGSNAIHPKEMKAAFEKLGREVSEAEVSQIISQHGLTKPGFITFQDFKVMIEALD